MVVIIARTLIIYLVLLLFMRILGKRQLGQLELSEFILASLAADMASNPLENPGIPLLYGVLPVVSLFCFEVLIVGAGLKWGRFRELLCGRPSILIKNGSICESQLRKNRLSIEELSAQLRLKGYTQFSDVQYAILETDGSLSVLPFPSKCPPTAECLGIEPQLQELSRPVISDGRIFSRNLTELGFDSRWLDKKLSELGAASPAEVLFLSADRNGNIYFARKEKP